MERTLDVATGESVAFRYELAGLGSRFYAVFIDMAVQFAILTAFVLLLAWIGSALPAVKAPAPGGSLEKIASGIVLGLVVFAVFMLFFGYFILFEWRWGGRTPGKRLLGIRVVRDGGFPLDFTSAVVRNVVRILEVGLGFYVVSARTSGWATWPPARSSCATNATNARSRSRSKRRAATIRSCATSVNPNAN
jgi:uncharacterized RDD family membrane protein YckC